MTDDGTADDGGRSSDGTFAISRSDFSDDRGTGDFASRYPATAWVQIVIEGVYLATIMAVAASGIMVLIRSPGSLAPIVERLLPAPGVATTPQVARTFQLWLTVFFAGVLGGATFATKWLYHSVSWHEWNRDRIIWRLSVPVLGGVMAVFTGCMIMSGIIPLLSKSLFARMASGAGYGFLVGLFADNFLAALQKFAKRLLGTLGRGT